MNFFGGRIIVTNKKSAHVPPTMSAYGVPVVSSRTCSKKESDGGAAPFQYAPTEFRANKSYYGVRILTGKQHGAITPRGKYVVLIGSAASSGKVRVIGSFMPSFGGWTEDLIIEADSTLGDILVVEAVNENTILDNEHPWYVSLVTVYNFQSNSSDDFPCYHWIGDEESVSFTARTTTLQEVSGNSVLLHQRKSQLEQRQRQYKWQKFPESGIPSGIDDTDEKDLPRDEEFDRVKNFSFTMGAMKSLLKFKVQGYLTSLEHLYNYEEFATVLGKPDPALYEASRWTSDVEFGRQMLNGVNPVIIQKCSSLPANFPVAEGEVKGLLNRGISLSEEMKAGHVYICDMKIFDGLPTKDGFYAAAPMCLLYVNGNDQLVPIAIQLKQQPGENNPIFMPSDHWIDWLLAKMFYQSAHSQFQQLATHYFSCHAAMEAYSMATSRNLPDPHPIYKLLNPHFRYTMSINSRARASLINDGGIIDQIFAIGTEGKVQLIQRASKAYSVYWTDIKRNLKERGVDDPNQLPGYFYRDDGLKVWTAMEDYVRSVVSEFYRDDQRVKEDAELQKWAEDIHVNGFPGYYGASDGHGFPKQIETKDELVELCTLIAFTGSAQHAAVNFGQYSIYSFVPNAPFEMRQPPPTKKGVTDIQKLLDTLPDSESSGKGLSITHLLSEYSSDEIFLGNYPSKRFTETKVQGMIQKFAAALQTISEGIQERNKTLDVPYPYFLKDRVPNSITI